MNLNYCKTRTEDVEKYVNEVKAKTEEMKKKHKYIDDPLHAMLLPFIISGLFLTVYAYIQPLKAVGLEYNWLFYIALLILLHGVFVFLSGGFYKIKKYGRLNDFYKALARIYLATAVSNAIEMENEEYVIVKREYKCGYAEICLCMKDDKDGEWEEMITFEVKDSHVLRNGSIDFTYYDEKFTSVMSDYENWKKKYEKSKKS